jgi:hypothetical protein
MKRFLLFAACIFGLISLGNVTPVSSAPRSDDAAPAKKVVKDTGGVQSAEFYNLVKLKLSVGLRKAGKSRDVTQGAIDALQTSTIDQAAVDNKVTVPVFPTATAPSGTLLAEIIAFLGSPEGQALIAALIQMLIAAIGGG